MKLIDIVNQIGVFQIGAGALILLTLIQIAPIKINPWSWLAKKVRHALIGELITKIEKVESEVSGIRKEMGEDRAISARVRILRFNDEMMSNQLHSKESFDQALDDCTDYEHYCNTHPDFKNNRTKMAVQNIERCYQKCLETHDFL